MLRVTVLPSICLSSSVVFDLCRLKIKLGWKLSTSSSSVWINPKWIPDLLPWSPSGCGFCVSVCFLLSSWTMLVGGFVLDRDQGELLIMYIEQEEAGRRIFIPSVVLSVNVVIVVLVKHIERERQSSLTILMFHHQNHS